MKIALVISSLSSGGAERVISNMANHWAAKGWDVSLLTFSGVDIEDFYALDPRVRRIYLDMRRPSVSLMDSLLFNGRRLRALRRELRELAPDVVISFMDSTNVLTILASVGMPHRVIVSERVDPVANPNATSFWRLARRLTYRFAYCVVAQTSGVGEWLERNCGARIAEIPNPLRPLPVPESPREPLVVAVGRLSQQKGFDLLLQAFARLTVSFPEWRLVILGEGPERERLEALRKAFGLEARVDMPGRVTDVERWLARASLMVQPSRFEGFPNVLLEGMGMGVAVVSADCRSGPADIIEDGKNGRLVPVEDVHALAEAMSRLMADPEARSDLAGTAIRVRERYSSERIMECWEALLVEPQDGH